MNIRNTIGTAFHTTLDFLYIGEKKIIPWITHQFKDKKLLEIGAKLTYYYFAIFLVLFWWKIPALFLAPLSNVGDFLAGVFGPVAFCWLIIGYLMQNKELSMNREELKISREALQKQAEELRNSVEQQKEIVRLMEIEMNISKKSELPIIEFLSSFYYEKGETIKTIYGERTAKKDTMYIILENTGKEISHGTFYIFMNKAPSRPEKIQSDKQIIKNNSQAEFYLEIDGGMQFNREYTLFFNFLTNSLNHRIYRYTFSISKKDNLNIISLESTIDHNYDH